MKRPQSLLRPTVLLLAGIGLPSSIGAQTHYENYTFTTFAGPQESPGWYDGSGSAARFANPFGVAVDGTGNVYVADTFNHTLRKITPAGAVTTLAGLADHSGSAEGDGSTARFFNPYGVAVDSTGHVYVADTFNHTIRKITPAGAVTTLAGSAGNAGNITGTRSAARFQYPAAVAIDASGNVYVADTANHAIRKITPNGAVTTLAGSAGNAGSADGTGSAARFSSPNGVAVDTNGNVYVADTSNHTLRKITPAGSVTTLAGSAESSGSANGTGAAARFYKPCGLTVSANGNVFVADTYNHALRKITPDGVVATVAGTAGSAGSTDGTASAAQFDSPTGVAVDAAGNVFVADYSRNLIRKMTTAAVVTTFAGRAGGFGAVDGAGNAARLNYPSGTAVDGSTNVYVTDLANHTIRKITPAGVVTTLAGMAGREGSANGTGSAAQFNTPTGVAVDTNGNVYVADTYNHTIRMITPAGSVTTLAGSSGLSGANNGTGSAAQFYLPMSVAVDTSGNVYVADTWNHTIRKITPAGTVTTFAGTAGRAGNADGTGTAATFYFPQGIAADRVGNLYVADNGNHTIRKIMPTGAVTTLAGLAGSSDRADGTGRAARFYAPFGIAVDSSGHVYVGDSGNQTIRKITPAGLVTTLAGTPGLSGTANGSGATARFNCPEGLAVLQDGTVYLADACNHTIRKGSAAPPDFPVVDLPLAKPGVVRQMDVTNLTTTSWAWSIVRHPAASRAQLSSATIRNPTLTPDDSELYVVRFEGADGSGRVGIWMLELASSAVLEPKIIGIRVSAANVVLTGEGGAPGATYSVLISSNVNLPVSEWSVLSGDEFDKDGHFVFANRLSNPAGFYRIRIP
ncbi:MAG: SBBP repeat-containing protein [Verrucomicrobia bacterium]|nr:SBBP repeat-containing protein [Verrucomicrobiota bacterium]